MSECTRPAQHLLKRDFEQPAPNFHWITNFAYVWTSAGWVSDAFVVDAYARRTLGVEGGYLDDN